MRTHPLLWLMATSLLFMVNACGRSVHVPDVEELPSPEGTVVEEMVFDSEDEKELGTISLSVVNTFTDGMSTINCDSTHTLYFQFYSWKPNAVTNVDTPMEEVECDVELYRSGGGGSATTTGTIPITYNFHPEFAPFPKCELTLSIEVLMEFSQVKVLHDTLLGDIPLPEGLGKDLLTVFPPTVLSSVGETVVISSGLVNLWITAEDYVIPAFTKCIYIE